jgi:hypothetical protein
MQNPLPLRHAAGGLMRKLLSRAMGPLALCAALAAPPLAHAQSDRGVALHGFADVGAGWSSGDDPSKLSGFNGGLLDLYLTPQFGPRVKGLIEIALEYGSDGGLAVDMERLQLGYLVNGAVTLWAGRFHTPFGWWNTAFHHGANLQTAISRPRFIDFEDRGGLIPAHSVGVWASGKTPIPGAKISYDVFVANGPRIAERTLDFNAFTDNSPGKMLGGNVGYLGSGALSGLILGVHAFGSTVNAYDTNSTVMSRTKLRMAGAYFGYDENNWEAIGEYYRFGNTDGADGTRRNSSAWFAQLGREFGAVTPFVRHERVSLDTLDNYFRSQEAGRPYSRSSLGARYAIDSHSSLKIELSHTSEKATTLIDAGGALVPFSPRSYRRAALQFSVAF